jgi:hypothetical protein
MSAGLASSLLHSGLDRAYIQNKQERQNRRAKGTSAGEKRSDDESSLSEFASFSPAAGDHSIACRSAAKKRKHQKTQRPPLGVLVVNSVNPSRS